LCCDVMCHETGNDRIPLGGSGEEGELNLSSYPLSIGFLQMAMLATRAYTLQDRLYHLNYEGGKGNLVASRCIKGVGARSSAVIIPHNLLRTRTQNTHLLCLIPFQYLISHTTMAATFVHYMTSSGLGGSPTTTIGRCIYSIHYHYHSQTCT
jgi:hypothetical protein